jgi:REP element-mobilizing transposase RayT
MILDEFMIMPNHIHGILIFNKNDVAEDALVKEARVCQTLENFIFAHTQY